MSLNSLFFKGLAPTLLLGLCLLFSPIVFANNLSCASLADSLNNSIQQKRINKGVVNTLTSCKSNKNKLLATQLCNDVWRNHKSILPFNGIDIFYADISSYCETSGALNKSLRFIEKAVLISEQSSSSVKKIAYLEQWAELLRKMGKSARAEKVYARARYELEPASTLQSIFQVQNQQLSPSRQRNLYEKNLSIHIKKLKSKNLTSAEKNKILEQVINIVEGRKISILDNYFEDDCFIQQEKIIPNNGEAILYPILLSNNQSVVLLITKNRTNIHFLHESKKSILSKVRIFLKLLRTIPGRKKEDTVEALESKIKSHGHELYNLLIKPVKSLLRNIDHLIIIPDTEMGIIPFEAFSYYKSTSKPKRLSYLVNERYAISYLPSLSTYYKKRQTTSRFSFLFAGLTTDSGIGDDIKDGQRSISKTFHNNGRSLIDRQFTKTQLLHAISNKHPSIIHIASHAKFEKRFTDSYFSVYAKGKLKVPEFEKIVKSSALNSTSPEILVLSACDTAKEEVGAISSSFGLAGVASRSGIKTVIASLWKVNYAFTMIAGGKKSIPNDYFYNLLNKKRYTKAKALQIAKQKFIEINDQEFSTPNTWASFVLIGDWHEMGY